MSYFIQIKKYTGLNVIGAGRFTPAPGPEAPVPVAYALAFKAPQPVATGWGHSHAQTTTKKDAVRTQTKAAARGVSAPPHSQTFAWWLNVSHPLGRFDTSSRQLKNCRLLIFF